jgi:hypothetical protein
MMGGCSQEGRAPCLENNPLPALDDSRLGKEDESPKSSSIVPKRLLQATEVSAVLGCLSVCLSGASCAKLFGAAPLSEEKSFL